ncbi:DUF397 domain-containing protein [Streptomyces rishiriensis]|uniref:DUF397 domain-containing protein n=1 Tax=Streptomyces rishiriensis TaxID=68264 RepID=UPI0037B44720
MSFAAPSGKRLPVWFTSSYSNGAGGECVECALMDDGVLVRDSKSVDGAEIDVSSGVWISFIRAVALHAEGRESA